MDFGDCTAVLLSHWHERDRFNVNTVKLSGPAQRHDKPMCAELFPFFFRLDGSLACAGSKRTLLIYATQAEEGAKSVRCTDLSPKFSTSCFPPRDLPCITPFVTIRNDQQVCRLQPDQSLPSH